MKYKLIIIFFLSVQLLFSQKMDSVLRKKYECVISPSVQKSLIYNYKSPRLQATFRTSISGTNYTQTYGASKEQYDGMQISQTTKYNFRLRFRINKKYRINFGTESLVLKPPVYYIGFRKEF